MTKKIRIIHAASILGLKPTGTQFLADRFIEAGLPEMIDAITEIIYVPDLNFLYSTQRDADTGCLNTRSIQRFSLALSEKITTVVNAGEFAIVLGGDCSVLIGILSALKGIGKTGLVFIDAHADFYSPETSVTGEVADMDLAIVSGRGPDILTNINQPGPYVEDENVIHIGQRDQEETSKYGSPDIRKTKMHCISAGELRKAGLSSVTDTMVKKINYSSADYYWIHFDTDVLDDKINPAVDYRLPGGLNTGNINKGDMNTGEMNLEDTNTGEMNLEATNTGEMNLEDTNTGEMNTLGMNTGGLNIEEVQTIIRSAIATGKCKGMSITIYNPLLDKQPLVEKDGIVCQRLVNCIAGIFKNNEPDLQSVT